MIVDIYFSVIIPTKNRLNMLKRAIDSVLNQSFKKFEIVIIDDHSTDGTFEFLEKYSRKDHRIRFFKNNGSGACPARNYGIIKSKGSVLAFLDDDDEWMQDYLKFHFYEHKKSFKVGLVYSAVVIKWEQDILPSQIFFRKRNGELSVKDYIAADLFLPTMSCATIKRNCIESCGMFDEHLDSYQDFDLVLRIILKYEVSSINQPLGIFNQHLGISITKSWQKREKTLERIKDKWGREYDLSHLLRHFHYDNILRESRINALQDNKSAALQMLLSIFPRSWRELRIYISTLLLIIFGSRKYSKIVKRK